MVKMQDFLYVKTKIHREQNPFLIQASPHVLLLNLWPIDKKKKKATVIHISSAIKSKQKLTLLSKWTMDGLGFKPLNCGSVATTAVAEVSLAAIESLSLGEFSL